MRFALLDYQVDAVADILGSLDDAADRFEQSGKLTAISFSAPTASGKTVIATALIELVLYGDEEREPDPLFTVLWVTDDPNLNQQTKRKMLIASSHMKPSQLVAIDQSLDKELLDTNKVYFAHIQQLGKGATNYVKTGDNRRWSLWETIANTIAARGASFLLVIDEAHRGARTTRDGGKTITGQLVDGAGGELPAPVVLGLSATPQRFIDAVSRVGHRILEPVSVDIDRVRASGLIKDKIRIRHPREKQPADSTLIELAVHDLLDYRELWDTYSLQQDEPPVDPVLVIQVRPKVADNELRAVLDTLVAQSGDLAGKAIGHSFQDHVALNLGQRTVRYVAPQDIQDDSRLRVVLFKEALATGWDCPRAEVMVSLRSAQDHTYIAQLIGRMVRTPLAHRISTDEVLNTVSLFLPYFDDSEVHEVVSAIQSAEGGVISTAETDSIVCSRNPTVPKSVWDLLAQIPTYTRPAKRHRNEVARLNALAVLLVGTELEREAVTRARSHVVDTLRREANRLGSVLEAKAASLAVMDYETRTVDLASGGVLTEQARADLNARNIDDLFRRAKRVLGDAAAKWYWDALCNDSATPDDAKLMVAALASEPTVAPAVETAAESLVDAWRTKHNSAINNMPEAIRAGFYAIWETARRPQQVALIMPTQITTSDTTIRHAKHLYSNGKKLFPVRLTGWEADVLGAEVAKGTLVAWYRNPPGGRAAVAIPYEQSGVQRTLYPDFLFFHDMNDELVCDVVDPHRPDDADAGPKWRGLASYAEKHGHLFGSILAVIKDDHDELLSLNVKNPASVRALAHASNDTDIRNAFAKAGGPY